MANPISAEDHLKRLTDVVYRLSTKLQELNPELRETNKKIQFVTQLLYISNETKKSELQNGGGIREIEYVAPDFKAAKEHILASFRVSQFDRTSNRIEHTTPELTHPALGVKWPCDLFHLKMTSTQIKEEFDLRVGSGDKIGHSSFWNYHYLPGWTKWELRASRVTSSLTQEEFFISVVKLLKPFVIDCHSCVWYDNPGLKAAGGEVSVDAYDSYYIAFFHQTKDITRFIHDWSPIIYVQTPGSIGMTNSLHKKVDPFLPKPEVFAEKIHKAINMIITGIKTASLKKEDFDFTNETAIEKAFTCIKTLEARVKEIDIIKEERRATSLEKLNSIIKIVDSVFLTFRELPHTASSTESKPNAISKGNPGATNPSGSQAIASSSSSSSTKQQHDEAIRKTIPIFYQTLEDLEKKPLAENEIVQFIQQIEKALTDESSFSEIFANILNRALNLQPARVGSQLGGSVLSGSCNQYSLGATNSLSCTVNALVFLNYAFSDQNNVKSSEKIDEILKEGAERYVSIRNNAADTATILQRQATTEDNLRSINLMVSLSGDMLSAGDIPQLEAHFFLSRNNNRLNETLTLKSDEGLGNTTTKFFKSYLENLQFQSKMLGTTITCNGFTYGLALTKKDNGTVEYRIFDSHGCKRLTGHINAFIYCTENREEAANFLGNLILFADYQLREDLNRVAIYYFLPRSFTEERKEGKEEKKQS